MDGILCICSLQLQPEHPFSVLDGPREPSPCNESCVVSSLRKLKVSLFCSPLPILTVDEFILLHEVIQAVTSLNPEAVDLLRNVRSTIGRNLLGNLLDLGKVAFAPATPDVLAFADHMVKNHGKPYLLNCSVKAAQSL